MAILMRTELQGVTSAQIVPFIATLNEEMRSYPGFICQAAGPTPGGFQVTEVWESQEAHERWLREVVAPRAMRELGLAEAPVGQYSSLDLVVIR